jgi:hypothetical protein
MIGSVARSAFDHGLIKALIRVELEIGDSLASSVDELAELTGGAPERAIREWLADSFDRTTREYQIVDALLAHGSLHLASAAVAGEIEIGGLNDRFEWGLLLGEAFSIKRLKFDFAGDGIEFGNGQRLDAVRVRFVADEAAPEEPALSAQSSIQHGVHASARRKTGPKFAARDAAIEQLLGGNLQPNVSWKEFVVRVCDEADGWTDQKKTRERVGYNIRAIKRAVAKIQKEKGVTNSNSS